MEGWYIGPGDSQEHIEAVLFLLGEEPPPRRMENGVRRRDYLQRLVEAFQTVNARMSRVSQGIRHTPEGFVLVPLPARHLDPPVSGDTQEDKGELKNRLAEQIAEFLCQDLAGIEAFPSPRPKFKPEILRDGREAVWQHLLAAIHHRPPIRVQ